MSEKYLIARRRRENLEHYENPKFPQNPKFQHFSRFSAPKESVHYASTPTLYYDQNLALNTALNIQQNSNYEQPQKYKSTMYLHSASDSSDLSSETENDLLTLSAKDLKRAESSIKGHKSKIYVSKCMANLYACPKLNLCHESEVPKSLNWSLKFTGIPTLIHDLGNTKSRIKRQIQLCLIEKGTGFVLWKDVVDHLTKYQVSKDYLFHTMHLSTDHSNKIGLSFDAPLEAREFSDWLTALTNDPANISLSGPYRVDPIRAAIIEEAKR